MKVNINVGDIIAVAWSNGHGESVYRVVDTFEGIHGFELLSEREYGDGDDDGMVSDDYDAVLSAARARLAIRSGSAE